MKKLSSRQISAIVHIAILTLIFSMLYLMATSEPDIITSKRNIRFISVMLSVLVIFYTNFLLLIDKFLFARKKIIFFASNIIMIFTIIFFNKYLSDNLASPNSFEQGLIAALDSLPRRDNKYFFFDRRISFMIIDSFIYSFVVITALAIKVIGRWQKAENERKELEKVSTEAELQNLKSQLNPHFLFNTLNNLYSLIYIDSEKAQEVVHELSRLLRYVLYDSSKPNVSFKEEVEFVSNYIELMKIRQPNNVTVSVSLPQSPSPINIAPLLFISLIENAFKHGVCNEKPSHIDIEITQKNNSVKCKISNSYFPKNNESDKSGSGIGLVNLKKRLDVIYPNNYIFKKEIVEGDYITLLQINNL